MKPTDHQKDLTQTSASQAKQIKLGIDVHADRYVVVRILDGGTPQPPQRFSPAEFPAWAQKQLTQTTAVFACYEAGPFGYGLHRQLTQLGVTNFVVRPRDWDEYGKRVKTDNRDARELALALDKYVSGNRDAFCVVRVPTEAEEQKRSVSRQRESLQKEKQRLAAQGRSHVLYYGGRLQGEWWKPRRWSVLAAELTPFLTQLLAPLQRLLLAVEEELQALTQQLEAAAPAVLPLGLGALTQEILEREIGDWQRFKNRRQVASYTGLCPREDSSAQRRFQGAINKHGNRRLRPVLVECLWRLCLFQPNYRVVKKWRPTLLDKKTGSARRKKIIVAMARAFAVDWWRVRTGRCQPEALGFAMKACAPIAAVG
jgi:transposase